MTEHLAKFCPGCGHPIVLMMLKKVLEEKGLLKKTVMGLDIGCLLLGWDYLPIHTFQTHHGRVTPTMLGFKRAKSDAICVGISGDGGAYAIGWQSLFHAVRRDEPITVLVVNNTVYGMTGGQASPTGIKDKNIPPIYGPELLHEVANHGAYLARTAVNDPKQMQEYLSKAIDAQLSGHFSLIEFLSFCPTNWRTKGAETNKYLDEKLKTVFKTGEI